ncbi:unnamed protein product [Leptosia nina]|uniref:Uncharacterized protein n=1 Tax=Leptosia nina TaxID=320188 RepID=A0AAV1JKX2_9NEOP
MEKSMLDIKLSDKMTSAKKIKVKEIMKYLVFFCAVLAVGTSALPQKTENEVAPKQQRLITNTIRNLIRQISRAIKENGLDPVVIDDFEYEYNIPFLVDVRLFIEKLRFIGASDIVIKQLDYSAIFNRLRFDIELPHLLLVVVDSGVTANIFGEKYSGQFLGSVAVNGIGLSGEVRVNIGIISGISIRSLDVKFRLDRIKSNTVIVVLGEDWSLNVNNLLNNDIPNLLKTHENDINKFLSELLKSIADSVLKPNGLYENMISEV